jgi:hypothetical protein
MPWCQQQREVAGTAADVQQPAGAVEHQRSRECVRQCRRKSDPTDRVVARAPRIRGALAITTYLRTNPAEERAHSLDRIAELLSPPLRVEHLEEMLDTIASLR